MKELLFLCGALGKFGVSSQGPCGQNHRFFTIPKMAPPTNDIRMVILGSTIDLPKRNRCWSCGRRNFSAKKTAVAFFFCGGFKRLESSCCVFWRNFWLVVSNIFYLYPYPGKWSRLTHIFQMGWNHQLDLYCFKQAYNMFFLIRLDVSYWNCSSLLMMCIYPIFGSHEGAKRILFLPLWNKLEISYIVAGLICPFTLLFMFYW